jgi:hypothetical protein
MKRIFHSILLLVSIQILIPLTYAQAEQQKFFFILNDQTLQKTSQVDESLKKIGTELSRLESEYKSTLQAVNAAKKCKSLDCRQLKKSFADMDDLLDQAETSIRLAIIATEQRQNLADSQRGVISSISKGKSSIANTLWWQQTSVQAGEIMSSLTFSLMTGNPVDLYATSLNLTATWAANKVVDYGVDQYDGENQSTDLPSQLTGDFNGSDQSKAVLKSLTRSLTRIGVVSGNGRFTPSSFAVSAAGNTKAGLSHLSKAARITDPAGLKKNVKLLNQVKGSQALRQGLRSIGDTVVRATISALTANATAETKRNLKMAERELSQAINFQLEMQMAAILQGHSVALLREQRNSVHKLRDRLFALRSDCHYEDVKSRCRTQRDADMAKAVQHRDREILDATKKRESIDQQLATLQEQRSTHFKEVQETHQKLREARGHLADARELAKNRDKMEALAKQARDAEVREKYRLEIERLSKAGGKEKNRKEVDRLTSKRAQLWAQIENLEADISKLITTAGPIRIASSNEVLAAEAAFTETRRKLDRAYDKCAGLKQRVAPSIRSKPLSEIQARVEKEIGQLYPEEIYAGLMTELERTVKNLKALKLQPVTRNDDQCAEKPAQAEPDIQIPLSLPTGQIQTPEKQPTILKGTNFKRQPPAAQSYTGSGKSVVGPLQTTEGALLFHIRHKTKQVNAYFSVHIEVDTNGDGNFCAEGDSGCGLVYQAGYENIYALDVKEKYESFFYGGAVKLVVNGPGNWEIKVSQSPYPRHVISGVIKEQLIKDGRRFDIWPGSEGAVITATSDAGDSFEATTNFVGDFTMTIFGDTDYRLEVHKPGYQTQTLTFPAARFRSLENPTWPHKLEFSLPAGP